MSLINCQNFLRDLFSLEIEEYWWKEILQVAEEKLDLDFVLDALIHQDFHRVPMLATKDLDCNKQTLLKGKFLPRFKLFQIDEVLNVSKSSFNSGEKNNPGKKSRPCSRRLLKLAVTDGVQMKIALEAFVSHQLNSVPLLGSKIAIKMPLQDSLGVILLSDSNFVYFGGPAVLFPRESPNSTDFSHKDCNLLHNSPVAPVPATCNRGFPSLKSEKIQRPLQPSKYLLSTATSKLLVTSNQENLSASKKGLLEALLMGIDECFWIKANFSSLIPPLIATKTKFIVRCELRDGNISVVCYIASEYIKRIVAVSPFEYMNSSDEKKELVQHKLSVHAFSLSKQDTCFYASRSGKYGLVIKSCVNTPFN